MPQDYRNVNFSAHLETDSPSVRLEGNIATLGTKAAWVSLVIGGLTITLFTPTPLGVEHILKELTKGVVRKESEFEKDVMKLAQRVVSIPVEITSYNADPAQTDSTPTITASGQTVREGICALSRDIEQEFGLEFGDKVDLGKWGVYEFQDRMNKRIKRGVDIFKWDRQEALEIGRRAGTATILARKDTEENA